MESLIVMALFLFVFYKLATSLVKIKQKVQLKKYAKLKSDLVTLYISQGNAPKIAEQMATLDCRKAILANMKYKNLTRDTAPTLESEDIPDDNTADEAAEISH